jgi:Fic family protein
VRIVDVSPYIPAALPLTTLDAAQLVGLIGPANAALARYDGLLQSIVNPGVLLSPLTNQEAVLSSKIEGTQATIDEVLEYEAGMEFDPEKVKDIQEVVNYRQALVLGAETLAQRPLNLALMRQMHAVLMNSVRGQDKTPGLFRVHQNWIGPHHCTIEQATFVPPSPLQLLDHLEAFERYLAGSDVDPLVQVAVVHAQFELLHPFNDGNGRIGRLLIPLFLYQKRVLASPMFYLSEYLEAHRETYYAGLRAISADGNWTGWVAFFLEAIRQQAETNAARVRSIMDLYESMKDRVRELLRSQYAGKVLDALFHRPIFESGDFVQRTGIVKVTALKFLRLLREAGVLMVLREQSGSRPAAYAFSELLNRAEGRKIL